MLDASGSPRVLVRIRDSLIRTGATTVIRAQKLGLDPSRFLSENDSYSFFSTIGDSILTGPRGTN